MNVRRFESGAALLAHSESWLVRAEAENNLILGLAARNASYSDVPASWLAIEDARGEGVGVAMQTPPHNLLVTRMPLEAIGPLLDAVEAFGVPIPGVIGPVEIAQSIARAWCDRRGLQSRVLHEQRIYELTHVVAPRTVTGRMRVATSRDRGLLVEWSHAFHRDAGLSPTAATRIERDLDERLAVGRHYLLEVSRDAPSSVVSMASVVGFTPRGARVGGVYTPVALRGRGHASTLVAALSQRLLDEGRAFSFLYTDLANPTSNAIYQRIGYRSVSDARVIAFG